MLLHIHNYCTIPHFIVLKFIIPVVGSVMLRGDSVCGVQFSDGSWVKIVFEPGSVGIFGPVAPSRWE